MRGSPMSIYGLGMVSSLASGAAFNASAMRCAYDGFTRTAFVHPGCLEPLIGAPVGEEILGGRLNGTSKLVKMASLAIEEAIQPLSSSQYEGLTAIFCLPDRIPASYFNNETAFQEIVDAVLQGLELFNLNPASCALWRHRCGFTSALSMAQRFLYRENHEFVLIVTLDSYLNQSALGYYSGTLYGENDRLLCKDNPNGFIPGEAATAVLLRTPGRDFSGVNIIGVGEAEEVATIGDEEAVMKGTGLSQAINQAAVNADIGVHETDFRVASMSGETYFFSEAAYAQSRTLKTKIDAHPVWHPAAYIGEVGASIGGAIVIMAYYAFLEGYAPGPTVLCHISNDDKRRGAFIMQHRKGVDQ